MHHVTLDRWSQGGSFLHKVDARAKSVAVLAFLISVATAQQSLLILFLAYFALAAGALVAARVPFNAALGRAAAVLPFTLVFAVISLAAGEPERAGALVGKSYLSALAVLLLVSTTPLPELLRGWERMGAPRFLLMVAQFLYRYLFVIFEEAQHMRAAALSKGGSIGHLLLSRQRFAASAGALGVLFARAYGHAASIHQAMLARGFAGSFRMLESKPFNRKDAAFALLALIMIAGVRIAAGA